MTAHVDPASITGAALVPDGILRDATYHERYESGVLYGRIYNDRKGRFADGTWIWTSKVVETLPGDLYRTRNSLYLVEQAGAPVAPVGDPPAATPAEHPPVGATDPLTDLAGLSGYVYVATPYTDYPLGHAAAAYDAADATAKLMRRGLVALSPIAHSHAVARVGRLDAVDHGFWQRQDQPLVDNAVACVVVMLDGWNRSKGVTHEIRCFEAAGKPVVYVRPGAL